MLTNGRLIAAGESHVMLSFEWKSSTLDMDWPARFVEVESPNTGIVFFRKTDTGCPRLFLPVLNEMLSFLPIEDFNSISSVWAR